MTHILLTVTKKIEFKPEYYEDGNTFTTETPITIQQAVAYEQAALGGGEIGLIDNLDSEGVEAKFTVVE